jgi:hypothetical protein
MIFSSTEGRVCSDYAVPATREWCLDDVSQMEDPYWMVLVVLMAFLRLKF